MKLSNPFKRRKSAEEKKAEALTLQQLIEYFNLHGVSAGELSEATYFACIKVLSESIGKLPLKLQQYTPDRGIRIAREHRYYRTLNERPNPFMTASTFWSTMEAFVDHYGNSYALIDESDFDHPKLWIIDPTKVKVLYDDACLLHTAPAVYYRVSHKNGQTLYNADEVIHFKSFLTLDGLVGISVREQLADTIQGNIKAQKLANRLYDNGMMAKAVLQYTGSLSEVNQDALSEMITEYTRDGGSKAGRRVIPLPVGTTITPLNLKLTDSQFLELKQYSALQIASAFGVKPYQIGDYTKSSYASAEAQQLSFLVDTLLFKLKQYEEEINYKVLLDDDVKAGFHSKFNVGVLLRADQQTQINTLSAAVSNFLMTPNEARERLDLPSKEGGDQLLGNGASIPVQYTGAQYTNIHNEQREEEKAWLKKTITEILTTLRE